MSSRALADRRLAIGIVLAAILAAQAPPSSSERDARELERIRREIGALKSKLHVAEKQTATIERDLQTTELKISIAEKELDLLASAEETLRADRERVMGEVKSIESKLTRQRRVVAQRLDALYRMGNLGYLRMLLAVSSDANPFEAISTLGYLATRDVREFRRLRSMEQTLSERRNDVLRKTRALERVLVDSRVRRQSLEQERASQTQLLASLRTETERSSARIVQLEEKARRLQRLLDLLYERSERITTGNDVREFRGVLQWPVRGPVLVPFGKRRSDKFATWTMHNGIRVGAPENAEVRAIFPGTVLYSQWFRGYGNLVIVDHGNRVFSLYGNTRMSAVSQGHVVRAGQVIATVADGEAESLPPHLYFEIREDNKPADPRKWIR